MHLVIALRLFGASDNDAKHEEARHVMIAEPLGSRVESHDLLLCQKYVSGCFS